MKHKPIVNTEKLEINKPSELCQVLFVDEDGKGLTSTISAIELDLVNYVLYDVRKHVQTNKIQVDPENWFKHTVVLRDVVDQIGKYQSGNFENIIENFKSLRRKDVVINALGKNKELSETTSSFIVRIRVNSNKYEKRQKINVWLDGEIVEMILHTPKLFAKMFLKLQFSLKTKQSKLLYELLRDYNPYGKTIDFHLLVNLLNSNSERNKKFAYFNNDILKKSVNEINDKTNIFVSYEPIKEKLEDQRLQVTKIRFNVKMQPKERLKELGVYEIKLEDNKFYNKSKTKMNRLIEGGYKVVNEDAWIKSDIKKNEDRYEAETRIDAWLENTVDDDKNDVYEFITNFYDSCDDPAIVIDDYKLVGLFSRDAFTRNPQETIEQLNTAIVEHNNVQE